MSRSAGKMGARMQSCVLIIAGLSPASQHGAAAREIKDAGAAVIALSSHVCRSEANSSPRLLRYVSGPRKPDRAGTAIVRCGFVRGLDAIAVATAHPKTPNPD
jgi:hypothetical protein